MGVGRRGGKRKSGERRKKLQTALRTGFPVGISNRAQKNHPFLYFQKLAISMLTKQHKLEFSVLTV